MMLIVKFLITASALFAEENPLQAMLEKNSDINTRESTVSIDGVKYQKLEIESDSYYVVFKGRNGEIPYLLCEAPKGYRSEHLIEGSLKMARRKVAFVQVLRESCNVTKSGKREQVALDPQIGIYLPESPKDVIKNKKVGINPLNIGRGVNFTGDW